MTHSNADVPLMAHRGEYLGEAQSEVHRKSVGSERAAGRWVQRSMAASVDHMPLVGRAGSSVMHKPCWCIEVEEMDI